MINLTPNAQQSKAEWSTEEWVFLISSSKYYTENKLNSHWNFYLQIDVFGVSGKIIKQVFMII